MRTSRQIFAGVLLATSLSCDEPRQPAPSLTPSREPAVSQTLAPAPSASAKAQGEFDPYVYRVVRDFPLHTQLAVAKDKLVSCEECRYPGKPSVRLTDASGKQGPELPSVVPALDRKYGPKFSRLRSTYPNGPELKIKGGTRGEIYLEVSAQVESELDDTRLGGPWMSDSFMVQGDEWTFMQKGTPSPDPSHHLPYRPGSLARQYDDALARLPFRATSVVVGAGSPPMAFYQDQLATWQAGRWQVKSAPWSNNHGAVRLSDGATLVAANQPYRVARDGSIVSLIPSHEGSVSYAWLKVDGQMWLLQKGRELRVLAPKNPVLVVTPEAREAYQPAPVLPATPSAAPSTHSPAPSASVPTAANGPERPSQPWASPAGFHAACHNPFVVLSTPPKAGWDYAATAKVLTGLEPGGLRYFEVTSGSTVYFGAQASNEKEARGLIQHFEKKLPRSKPQLSCWDIASHCPNRYAPPRGIIEVMFNHHLGEQFLFMH